MKGIKNFLVILILTVVLVFEGSQQVKAASCAEWNINRYIPGAPSSIGNQSTSICLNYYSGGYYADCTFFSGGEGSALKITTSSGDMEPVLIKTTGRTEVWRLKRSTTGTVCFRISVIGDYPCRSTGRICINQ